MDQKWFEFRDIRKRCFNEAVWIPLRQRFSHRQGIYGYLGYQEDLNLATSVAFPVGRLAEAEKLGWSDIGFVSEHGVYASENNYITAESFQIREGEDFGTHLVIDQGFGSLEPRQWHLNQDLIIALQLIREGDVWVRPSEDYVEVARLTRGADGSTAAIEIRSEYLRDYLAARRMILKISVFRQRDEILSDVSQLQWKDRKFSEKDTNAEYDASILEINEGRGDLFGSSVAVFHVGRNDVDLDADIPKFDPPSDDNTDSKSWTVKREGKMLYRVIGKVWQNEIITPANKSPRVRGDKLPASCSFIVDTAGTRAGSDELNDEDNSVWLWFDPKVILTLANRRGGQLKWYTRYSGGVAASGDHSVHFGINKKSFINAYAYDIARLPEWQQRIWMGYNIAPDGGVSEELLSSQMAAKPSETLAPEESLGDALDGLNAIFIARWGSPLFRPHNDLKNILLRTNRFRSTDLASLLALAKDIARLTADSIDVGPLHAIVPLKKGEKRGSLKSLERVLATLIHEAAAHKLMGPLFAIYDLRLSDAHLPTKEIEEKFGLANVDRTAHALEQGLQLLTTTMYTLSSIARVVDLPKGQPRK